MSPPPDSNTPISKAIQWYPGHIAKIERELTTHLKLVDVAIEVLDARLPLATQNTRIQKKLLACGQNGKPTLIILNKADLADNEQTKYWKRLLKEPFSPDSPPRVVLTYDSLKGTGKVAIIAGILALAEDRMQSLIGKGLKRRPVRVLVVGMPNVGKSTIINSLVGQKKTKTGHKAGVTRQPQWVRIHPQIELLDTPGIIPPVLDSNLSGLLLACVSGIGEASFDEEEAARFFIQRLQALYPGLLGQFYKLSPNDACLDDPYLMLASISERLGHKQQRSGNTSVLDTLRTAQAVLKAFRNGTLGRLTLEHI
jgi:ribosome biogenesis GTPase A